MVYLSDLKSEFCEFESHLPHHVFVLWPCDEIGKRARFRLGFLQVQVLSGLPSFLFNVTLAQIAERQPVKLVGLGASPRGYAIFVFMGD